MDDFSPFPVGPLVSGILSSSLLSPSSQLHVASDLGAAWGRLVRPFPVLRQFASALPPGNQP